jgi:hypothetical protein
MRAQRLSSVILVSVLVAGCATHYKATERRPEADDRAGAVVANLWHVPGRAIICGTGAVLAGLAMTLTLGQAYDGASEIMHGGCSGPWTVKAKDIREAVADR